MDYTVRIDMALAEITARIVQLLCGIGQLAFATTLYVLASVAWQYEPGPKGYFIPLLPMAVAIILISGLGVCFYKNRQSIHWKIMSTLDWLAFVATLVSVPLCGVASGSANNFSVRFFVVLDICAVGCFLSSFFVAVRRHRPSETSSDTKPESWYSGEEGPTDYQPETVRNMRRVSQAMSRAETNARWSGVSGADTTVFTSMHADAVPPYNNGRASPVNSMLKEG